MNMNHGTDATTPLPINTLSELLQHDPISFFTQIRTQGSVVAIPFPVEGEQRIWMVTRMKEAVQVLKDSDLFTVESPVSKVSTTERQETASIDKFPMLNHSLSMAGHDGQGHKRLRGLVSKVFTPKYIQDLRPSIQQITDTLLDKVQEQGSMDLVNDFAFPLPINVISDMLGVPHDNWDAIRKGSNTLIELAPSEIALGGQASVEQLEKVQAFSSYIEQLIAEKRRYPQADLISQLVQLDEEDRLNEPELHSMIGLLIVAGHETTSNFISNGMLALFDHPEQLAMLKANLNLVPTAVEELLRFCGPVITGVPRIATRDVELGGQHISAGDSLILMLPSANHDEVNFTDAEELELVRSLNRHIAFGHGIHVCLGAPLARLEGDIAFTTLLRRLPNLRLNGPRTSITRRVTLNVIGLSNLPVAFYDYMN